jgi:uncharacterized protein (TIGR03437 family)
MASLRADPFTSNRPQISRTSMLNNLRSAVTHALSPTWARLVRRGLYLLLIGPAAFPQALPQFEPSGIVNAASYAQPISPGAIVSIFGTNLASTQATAQGAPLPTELAGTSVTINGTRAPLFYVSPTQINIQVPWSTEIALFNYTQASVMVTTAAGSSAPVQVPVFQSGPSLFSQDGSGCGQAAALNVRSDGPVSVNSPSNSAAPADFISLYGTGIGAPYNPPANGDYVTGLTPLSSPPGVVLGGNTLQAVQFAGLAPFLVGVDQVNFQIPQGTQEGCGVPVSLISGQFGVVGPTMSISVHSGRGQSVDPPTQSFGTVALTKTIMSGTAGVTSADTVTASFQSAPGLAVPPPPPPSQPGAFVPTVSSIAMSRSCQVNGNSQLSAGDLTVNATSTGQTAVVQPIPATGGVEYQQSLPNGFIASGRYTVSASGGPVQFQGVLTIPPPIQITTPLTPGTQISVSNNLVINWTGGAPGELVRLRLVANNGLFNGVDTAYVDASSGTFTFSPICTGNPVQMGGNGVYCALGFFMTPGSTAKMSVEVELLPSSGYGNAVSAQGLTQGVQLSWMYRYVFSGLSFSQ